MIQNCKDCCLNKLSLHDRSNDLYKRFSWEDNASFRDRVNITGKMEVTQIVQEIFPEDAKAAQISDIVVFKM